MIRTLKRLWRYIWRSSITGQFVTPDYAKEHKDTTEREKVK